MTIAEALQALREHARELDAPMSLVRGQPGIAVDKAGAADVLADAESEEAAR